MYSNHRSIFVYALALSGRTKSLQKVLLGFFISSGVKLLTSFHDKKEISLSFLRFFHFSVSSSEILFLIVRYSKYWTQHQIIQIFFLLFLSFSMFSNISSLQDETKEQVLRKTISVSLENGSVVY
jgi:hypothetical protein